MFSRDVIDSDKFYDLPFSSQLLYFHLGMHADVKGFIEPKKIIRLVGLKIEDLRPLIQNELVILFETGVVIITHWNIHNIIRDDREAETMFKKEESEIALVDNQYELLQDNSGSTPAQIRLDKVRLDYIYNPTSDEVGPSKTYDSYKEFIDMFNELASRSFRYGDSKARRQLKARMKDGYNLEDFKKALQAALADSFHKESDYKYLTPEFLTRSDKLDRFLAQAEDAPKTYTKTGSTKEFFDNL